MAKGAGDEDHCWRHVGVVGLGTFVMVVGGRSVRWLCLRARGSGSAVLFLLYTASVEHTSGKAGLHVRFIHDSMAKGAVILHRSAPLDTLAHFLGDISNLAHMLQTAVSSLVSW